MAFKNGDKPWNLGLTGREAGWTEARKRRMRATGAARRGPRPHLWQTGPDPAVQRDRYRYLRSRAQAKYWGQAWTITWDQYRGILARVRGDYGRGMDQLNLARKDCTQGWHIWNVHLISRKVAMNRTRTRYPDGRYLKRREGAQQ